MQQVYCAKCLQPNYISAYVDNWQLLYKRRIYVTSYTVAWFIKLCCPQNPTQHSWYQILALCAVTTNDDYKTIGRLGRYKLAVVAPKMQQENVNTNTNSHSKSCVTSFTSISLQLLPFFHLAASYRGVSDTTTFTRPHYHTFNYLTINHNCSKASYKNPIGNCSSKNSLVQLCNTMGYPRWLITAGKLLQTWLCLVKQVR